jgi:hypothetical protein
VLNLINQTILELKAAETAKLTEQVMELQQRFVILNQLKQSFSKDLGGRIII